MRTFLKGIRRSYFLIGIASLSTTTTAAHPCGEGFEKLASNSAPAVLKVRTIPSVSKLVNQQSIPTAVIKKHTPNQIAHSLVRRLDQNNDRIVSSPGSGFNSLRDTDIIMFFEEESLDSIIESGFRNYHQTGRSLGESTLHNRAATEDYLIQANIEKNGYNTYVTHQLEALEREGKRSEINRVRIEARTNSPYNRIRPKYAYLVVRDRSVDIGNATFRTQYGEVGAVFKEAVKTRSTWTPTDSLAARKDNVYTFQDQWVHAQVAGSKTARDYLEAQIWGDLDVSDIAYWIVPKGTSKHSEIVKTMKKTKIPVKFYEIEEDVYPPNNHRTYRPVILQDLVK